MHMELQRANMWKRISAWLFDAILLGMLSVGCAFLLSVILGYDAQTDKLSALYTTYETQYGVVFDMTIEEYDAMSAEERAAYEAAFSAFSADPESGRLLGLLLNMTLVILTFGILLGYLLLEFTVPLLFGNGQTLGKKVFGVAVMRTDAVRITPAMLFVRTVLGKFTIETMIPVLIVMMIFFGAVGIGGTLVILLLGLVQLVLLSATRTRSAIHDVLAQSVTVDLASQRIFENIEARETYLKACAAEAAARSDD